MTNTWLAAGGAISLGASLLHVAIIFGGPKMKRVPAV